MRYGNEEKEFLEFYEKHHKNIPSEHKLACRYSYLSAKGNVPNKIANLKTKITRLEKEILKLNEEQVMIIQQLHKATEIIHFYSKKPTIRGWTEIGSYGCTYDDGEKAREYLDRYERRN